MTPISVNGNTYKVTEKRGIQGGHYALAVETETGERIAVNRGGAWTWWTVQDRMQSSGCRGAENEAHERARI